MTSTNVRRVVVFAFATLTALSASAQNLDGTWLRLTVNGRGLSVDLNDDTKRRAGVFRGRCYMRLDYDVSQDDYDGRIACEVARRVYATTQASPSFHRFTDDRGGVATDHHAHFTNRKGQQIQGPGTHILSALYNRRGVLRRVTLESYGQVERTSSLQPGATVLMGGYGVRGVSIPERRVPLSVRDLFAPAAEPEPAPAPAPALGIANEILTLVNQQRAAGATCGGVRRAPAGPLTLHSALSAAAQRHATDMATRNYFDHAGLDGSSPFDRIRDAGFTGSPQGENIAAGYSSASSVVAGWMSSTGHCNNIMNGAYVYMGGALSSNASSTYGNYWVQVFGGN